MRRLFLSAVAGLGLGLASLSASAAEVPIRTAIYQPTAAAHDQTIGQSDRTSTQLVQYGRRSYSYYPRGYGYGYNTPYRYGYGYRPYYNYPRSFSTGGPYYRYTVPSPYAFGTSTMYSYPNPGGYRYYNW